MARSTLAWTMVSCALISGCVGAPESGENDTEATAGEEQVATAEEAMSWYCDGGLGLGDYHYCLTRCDLDEGLHFVGYSFYNYYFFDIYYNNYFDSYDDYCGWAAESYCNFRGWGGHHDTCFGDYDY